MKQVKPGEIPTALPATLAPHASAAASADAG
jgi:hypothetical protein